MISWMTFKSINPATEKLIAEYPLDNPQQIERKLWAAAKAFHGWRYSAFDERSPLMLSVANLLRSRREALAALMTAEVGKPITQALAEIDKCADACEFFANHAEELLATEEIKSDALHSGVRYEPLGAVLAIMPWNFPFWQVFRFAAPNVMAGNVGVLKHAPNVTGCAKAIEKLFTDAGFSDGIFATVVVDTPAVKGIIEHPSIVAVTLTGSERAGRSVAAIAGAVLKKTVLELGGSDPFLVLADVDIPAVATAAASARCVNSGQSCIAAKRFIVESSIADEFEAAFAVAMADLKTGDPTKRATQVGPLARKDLVEHLAEQVAKSVAAGARVVIGSHHLSPGFYFPPAVLSEVRPGMPVFDEETFGPVAAVIRAVDEHEMIELANHSRYGLGASIWTKDLDRADRIATKLHTGSIFINAAVKSDSRLPFGGIKNSGYGRELSTLGIREFLNAKTVFTA
jgi:succinate-semialdehyde dehydrogenase/glutarate-semialdehyde dehydrogenase